VRLPQRTRVSISPGGRRYSPAPPTFNLHLQEPFCSRVLALILSAPLDQSEEAQLDYSLLYRCLHISRVLVGAGLVRLGRLAFPGDPRNPLARRTRCRPSLPTIAKNARSRRSLSCSLLASWYDPIRVVPAWGSLAWWRCLTFPSFAAGERNNLPALLPHRGGLLLGGAGGLHHNTGWGPHAPSQNLSEAPGDSLRPHLQGSRRASGWTASGRRR
jgi:hypothetical protein